MLSHSEIKDIHDILRVLPKNLSELEVQLTRQSQFGSQYADGGKNAGEKPLYFDEAATNARLHMHELVVKYGRAIYHDWPTPFMLPPVRYGFSIGWLDVHVGWIRNYEDAPREFREAFQEIDKVIDIPRVRIYLGDCKACQNKLYGDPEADELVCPGCACEYEPKGLRESNQKRGEDMKVTAGQAREYIGEVLGIPLTPGRLNRWTRMGWITPIVQGGKGRGNETIYRLGDVIACVRDRAKESGDRSVRT